MDLIEIGRFKEKSLRKKNLKTILSITLSVMCTIVTNKYRQTTRDRYIPIRLRLRVQPTTTTNANEEPQPIIKHVKPQKQLKELRKMKKTKTKKKNNTRIQ